MVAYLPWLVNLPSLACDVDKFLSGKVSVPFSLVWSLQRDHCIYWWWNLIRSKQLFTGSVCHMKWLSEFFVIVILFIIHIYKSVYVCTYKLCLFNSISNNKLRVEPFKVISVGSKDLSYPSLPHYDENAGRVLLGCFSAPSLWSTCCSSYAFKIAPPDE